MQMAHMGQLELNANEVPSLCREFQEALDQQKSGIARYYFTEITKINVKAVVVFSEGQCCCIGLSRQGYEVRF